MAAMREEKQKYFNRMQDNFPQALLVGFADLDASKILAVNVSHLNQHGETIETTLQPLAYRKVTWTLPNAKGELEEMGLRYGDNPDQKSAMFKLVGGNLALAACKFVGANNGLVSAITEADMIQAGKHPGKTNLTDVDSALNILRYLGEKPACAIMKHNNPSGLAYGGSSEVTGAAFGSDVSEAYRKANDADRIAAFGGAAVFNKPIDTVTAEMINRNYLEVVCAPDFERGAVEILKGRKNLRIIRLDNINRLENYSTTQIIDFKALMDGGFIVQESQVNKVRSLADLKRASHKGYQTERWPPDPNEVRDMIFGVAVECGVTSNSVLYVKDETTVSVGTGQQDRLDVTVYAIAKAYRKRRDRECFKEFGIPYPALETMIFHKEQGIDRDYGSTAVNNANLNGVGMLREWKKEIDARVNSIHGGLIGATKVSDAFFPEPDAIDYSLMEFISAVVHPEGSDKDWATIDACNKAKPRPVIVAHTTQRLFKH
ncbi:MAG: IMP cyclohydrolase [Candidatus Woesearchaeota archaeon]